MPHSHLHSTKMSLRTLNTTLTAYLPSYDLRPGYTFRSHEFAIRDLAKTG